MYIILNLTDIDMKTFTFTLLTVFAYAARDADGNAIEDDKRGGRCGMCCRRLADADHELRMLCLPPSDQEQKAIDFYCNDEEELDACIVRLEADETANATALNDLRDVQEVLEARVAEHDEEHDHEHEDEGESGAFQGLSAVTALATAIVLAAF